MHIKDIFITWTIAGLTLGSASFVKWQQSKLNTTLSDTIDQRAANGNKYGRHVVTENWRTIQEWEYKDNKKIWLWITYYSNGNKENEITYATDWTARGPATFYYSNGNIKEQGNRQLNKWVWKYRFYYENGNKKYEREHADNGKRTGEQKYYHVNGNVYMIGKRKSWKEIGELSTYNKDGSLNNKKYFNENTQELSSTVEYPEGEVFDPISRKYNKVAEVKKFNGTWNHTLYTKNGKLLKQWYFEDWDLLTGKRFEYDTDGNLKKIYEYNNGKLMSTTNQ